MAMSKEERRAAQTIWSANYDAANSKRISVKLNIKKDSDILSRLAVEPSAAGYIKACIRKCIEIEEQEIQQSPEVPEPR